MANWFTPTMSLAALRRAMTFGNHLAPLEPLLLKITQGNGGWDACVRLRNPDGSKVEGVQTALLAPMKEAN
jgi:hypothetical protein